MNRHDKKMIVFVLVWVVCVSVLFSVAFTLFVGAIESLSNNGGAKPAIERLWCGKEGCMEGGK